MKYEEINYNELEDLAVIGGTDTNAITTADSAATTVATTAAVTTAVTAVTALTVAWSNLYSCTKNKITCKRK